MKRCPHCQFIYNNSDETCDFDRTPLVSVDDETIEAEIRTDSSQINSRSSKGRWLKVVPVVVSVVLLIINLGMVGVYLLSRVLPNQTTTNQIAALPLPGLQQSQSAPVATTVVAESTPEPTPKAAPSPVRTNSVKSAVSTGPVSTGSVTNNGKAEGKPVILLTTGGRIEADQVWRAREGVWYRRDGVVTLLKKERVRAIVGN